MAIRTSAAIYISSLIWLIFVGFYLHSIFLLSFRLPLTIDDEQLEPVPQLNGTSAFVSLYNPQCVFFDVVTNDWSSDGCRVASSADGIVSCECNHLTSFAVLMVSMLL